MDKADEQPTITQAQYESAVKGRQDFRNAYRNLLPVLRAAEELSRLWRTKGQPVNGEVFFNAINAVDVAVTGGGARPDPEHLTRTTSLAAQDGLVEALVKIPTAALYALRHGQQQADMDGTFVTVSRQALGEVLDSVDAALSAIKEQHHD